MSTEQGTRSSLRGRGFEQAEGDTVVHRLTARGTHTGNFQGIPPTGKQVTVTGININRFANSKVVESWSVLDTLGMLQQIGVIPPIG